MPPIRSIFVHLLRKAWKKPLSTLFTLVISLGLIVPVVLYHLLAYRLANDPRLVPESFRHAKNILLVTAHPDDETLFFSPSILYRSEDPSVTRALLVLSLGDYRGLGHIRRTELQRSCASLGIREERCVCLDKEEMQDNPQQWWEEDRIQAVVVKYLQRWDVDLIITFDRGGISGHINHRAVSSAIRFSFSGRIIQALFVSPPVRDSVVTIGKDKTPHHDAYTEMAFLVSNWHAYFRARAAFAQHQSQYSWDRNLYLVILPDFVKHMKRDPSGGGFTHLGKDGVLRTVSGDREVVDARGLTPAEIEFFLKVVPLEPGQKEDFQGVDGMKVTDHDALFHPAPGILPAKADGELVKKNQTAYLEAQGEK
ncbi:hypothetical protein FE257_000572 [Aspergillus nanangensis]|uniref:N-acetylglucosaminylphosphatidylinositol deacetylase n=1 Tax=Aspergillus nanangensis TaxID=2582783 RepID=A0AAD4CUK2_ASPNN|nr:hypothetical protein FE257_000572 [Aspergillus nanangensis]